MGKLPYMKFYPGDWLKDPSLRRCAHCAKGVYVDMLCVMWECDERGVLATAGKAWGDDEVALAIGGDQRQTLALVAELIDKGVVSRRANGAIYSRRMVRDEEDRRKDTKRKKNGRESTDDSDSSPPDIHVVSEEYPNDIRDLSEARPEYESESPSPDVLSVRKEREAVTVAIELYELYPKKVGRADALKSIRRAMTRASPEVLREAVTAFAAAKVGDDQQFIPNPATWFNQDRWNDDRKTWIRSDQPRGGGQSTTRIHSEGAGQYNVC